MTGQIADTFIFKGDPYSLIGATGEIFSPAAFGMTPVMIHTACYRGFYATYKLTEQALYLCELTIKEMDHNYVPIDGVTPAIDTNQNHTYHNLNVIVPFSGRIRLARDFIKELYVHMGFQKPSAFKTVLDITLEGGLVVEINDRSHEVEQMRGAFKRRYESGDMTGEIIQDAFSFDMELK